MYMIIYVSFHEKRRLPGKDPDVGKVWRQEEKGTMEDEMAGQDHWSDQHEYDPTPGGSGRQACSGPWGHKESDTTKWLNNNNKESQNVAHMWCYMHKQEVDSFGILYTYLYMYSWAVEYSLLLIPALSRVISLLKRKSDNGSLTQEWDYQAVT